MGPSRARALSSPLMLLLLGPRHSIVVGARARLVIVVRVRVCGRLVVVVRVGVRGRLVVVVRIRVCGRLLVVVCVRGRLVVAVCVRGRGRLLVVVRVRGRLVVVCTFPFGGGRWSLWAVDGRFGWPCRLLCTHRVRGRSYSWAVVGCYWR